MIKTTDTKYQAGLKARNTQMSAYWGRGSLVFTGTCVLTAGIIYLVHVNEEETRQRMKQGPKRDRERLEATTARLYEQALEQWKDEGSTAQQDQQPSRP